MNKQEQIEEMAKVIARRSMYFRNPNVAFMTTARKTADSLYKEGYRKADEMRKETAKEIFEEIEKLTYRLLNDKDYVVGDMIVDILDLAQNYGVEVE